MWNLTRAGYYADFVVIPFLALFALISDVSYHGLTVAMLLAFVVGFIVVWPFVEYATHRWLFHRVYRKEHWLHHIRPAAYVGVPSWQTSIGALLALGGCIGGFGLDIGAGLFAGVAAGYFLYIWAHDRFHHGPIPEPDTYWFDRMRAHDVHHSRGIEANFSVVSPFWDVLFGTYVRP